MSINLALYLNIGLSLLAGILAISALIISRKSSLWRKILKKDSPLEMDQIIEEVMGRINNLESASEIHESLLNQQHATLITSLQHIGLTRFNALQNEGGNLSFSLAILDAQQNGIILTSMYGRDGNRIYLKKVNNGVGEVQLSEEEQSALINAITKN